MYKVMRVKVWHIIQAKGSVKITADEKLKLLLPKGEAKEITQKITLKDDVTAPVKKGDVIGTAEIYVGEKSVGSIDIIAKDNVLRVNLWILLKWLLGGMIIL